jgi:hypothetical protein
MNNIEVSLDLLKAMAAYCLEQAQYSEINILNFAENSKSIDLESCIEDLMQLKGNLYFASSNSTIVLKD